MVRTMGGDYYEEFDKEGFVAIGYNEITRHEINKLDADWNKANVQLSNSSLKFEIMAKQLYVASQRVL